MKVISHHLHTFFFKPQDSFPLAFLRISVAFFGLLQTLIISGSWLDIYGVDGFVEWFISNNIFNIRELPSMVAVADLLLPMGIQENTVVLVISSLYVLSLFGVLLGWRTKISVFVAWITHFMICNTAMAFGYGMETFMHIGLFYLLFAPCSSYLSLDAKSGRTNAPKESSMAGFMIRVIQLHLCLVYFNAGIAKVMGIDWQAGEAIWYVLGNTNYSQFNLEVLANFPFISKFFTWWTLAIEILYPIGIFWKKSRLFWWINIILLHIGIGVFMGLYLFGLIMILFNIAAFGHLVIPEKMKSFLWKKWEGLIGGLDVIFGKKPLGRLKKAPATNP